MEDLETASHLLSVRCTSAPCDSILDTTVIYLHDVLSLGDCFVNGYCPEEGRVRPSE